MTHIQSLQLTNFRCYNGAVLDDLPSGPVVLYGANGAGKTNLLEAVSFLTPGRGLRGAKIADIQKQDSDRTVQPWAVSAQAEGFYGTVRLGSGADAQSSRRLVRVNGEAAKGQAALAEHVACIWLTPQMDRLFLEGVSARRRFLDRLIFAFDPSHAGRVMRYDKAMSQRSKVLKESPNPDASWLDGLEATMAETGIAIVAARHDFIRRLQRACDRIKASEEKSFPRARLRITGTVEELLSRLPALEVEDLFKYQLRETRSQDAVTGGAATGPHKGDMAVFYAAKDMPAAHCSTGEQKALLIGIILAHSRLLAAERGAPPILLLDEVAAHLDEERRAALYDILFDLGGQVWLTGTDKSLFSPISDAAFFHIHSAQIEKERRSRAA